MLTQIRHKMKMHMILEFVMTIYHKQLHLDKLHIFMVVILLKY